MLSFDLGLEDAAQSFVDPDFSAQDADLEANLGRLYADSVLVDEDLRGLFDSIDTPDLDPCGDSAVCPAGGLTFEGPLCSDKGDNGFLPRDKAFRQALDAGGANPSQSSDTWALNRLKKFMHVIGADDSIELVEMAPLRGTALLCEFFERVRKENRQLYPPPSLMLLLRAFNRIYCKAQAARVLQTGVDEGLFRSSSITHKSGRATMIIRMCESGVPPKVGMLITGHRSEATYSRYDKSSEMHVRAAQTCAEGRSSYEVALTEENQNLRAIVIEGKENIIQGTEKASELVKRVKLQDGTRSECSALRVIDNHERETVSEAELWAANYDWGSDAKYYEKGKAVVVNNPVSALFGNLSNCSLNVTFTGPMTFNGQGGH